DRDDGVAGPHLLGEADGAGHIDAGRAAHAQALVFHEIEDDRHRLLVGNEIRLVDLDVLDQAGDAPKTDAFGNGAAVRHGGFAVGEQVVHGGALRIGDADDD